MIVEIELKFNQNSSSIRIELELGRLGFATLFLVLMC